MHWISFCTLITPNPQKCTPAQQNSIQCSSLRPLHWISLCTLICSGQRIVYADRPNLLWSADRLCQSFTLKARYVILIPGADNPTHPNLLGGAGKIRSNAAACGRFNGSRFAKPICSGQLIVCADRPNLVGSVDGLRRSLYPKS